jgi:nicotinamide-nucleotide amidase
MTNFDLETLIGDLLRRRGWSLATAESCTGGLIGDKITNVPGSSDYYLGGVIAYSNQVKMEQLGVQSDILEQYGAVSRETVIEMARGVRLRFRSDVSLSVSGIAGPGGGSPEKPVGLTWIGLSTPDFEKAWQYLWQGDRLQVKEQTARQALRLLAETLEQGESYD